MKLYPEGKSAPEVETTEVASKEKETIKSYVLGLEIPDDGFYYDELVKEVQTYYADKEEYYTNDTILEIIKEIDVEWHPVVIEE